MKVLHVTPFYAPAWAYGGIPRAVHALVRAQGALEGVTVTVATTDVLDMRSRYVPDALEMGVYRFRNLSNTLAYRLMFLLPRGFRRFLRDHACEFDIVHLHGCRHVLNEIFFRSPSRPPFVLSPHGTLPRIESKILLKRLYDALLGNGVVAEAARILAVSAAEARQLAAIGCDRVAILPNIVEDPAADTGGGEGRSFRETFGIEGRYVLYLGKLTPRKRVDLLIEAYAMRSTHPGAAAPWPLLVVAGNDMGTLRSLTRLVRSRSLERRVIFVGLLTGRLRRTAMAAAEAIVYPGEHEVFGLVPFEGILAGAIPIVSDDSGCGELVREAQCGYVFARGDAAGLSCAIGQALDEPHRRAEMLQRGRAFLARFTPETVARRSIEIYRGIGAP
ncbi:MAG: glycosyltransferase [Acidobacteria bacterium]|nr:glycosyltransferase [Acidobacteriota bacterium]